MTRNPTVLYRGKIIDLCQQTVVLPNGATTEVEIVRHPGGAAVVAVDAAGRVCLLRQYRPALAQWLWELPAGRLEPGEAPEATIRRELEEEAGLRAEVWRPLGKIISSPGVFTEAVHLFEARELRSIPAKPEAHEVFEVHWVPLAEALTWIRSGEISDAKTIVGLLRTDFERA